MYYCVGNPLQRHQAVPLEDVKWLDKFMKSGSDQLISFKDACFILRRKLFPFCYDPHPWVTGRPETNGEVLKSLMAIYINRMEVARLRSLSDDPANFSDYLYQPEIGEGSCELVHHREDHNHLLKRIVSCLRDGRIPGIDLRYMREALHDPNTGLTYEALTGKNKQSVPDCERLISPGVIACLEKTHKSGADVIRIIHNWHKAVDGRGLNENQRSQYCEDMKFWLLDDWMPWHRENKDYSLTDVNRLVYIICISLFHSGCQSKLLDILYCTVQQHFLFHASI